MSGHEFLDTNILVYAYDNRNPDKQRIARDLVVRAVAGEFVLSTQILAEFAATLLHKVTPRAAPDVVVDILDTLAPIPLIKPNAELVRRAVEAHKAYGVHFYDGMIIAAAECAGSEKIFSEDLRAGQDYFGISVENPFR